MRARDVMAILVVSVLVALVCVAASRSSGATLARVGLGPGWAWFAAPSRGELDLLHGPTASRVDHVVVAAPGDRIDVAQTGADAYIANRTTGLVRRVEGSSFEAEPAIQFDSIGDEGLRVIASDGAPWVIFGHGSLVEELDPLASAVSGSPHQFPGTITSAVVARHGALWVVDAATGIVRSYEPGNSSPGVETVVDPGAELVAVAGAVFAVDAASSPAAVLELTSGERVDARCFDLSADAGTVLGGSGAGATRITALIPASDLLVTFDVESGDCSAPVQLDNERGMSRYGNPVEHRSRVFVPDLTNGTVIVVDPARGQIVTRIDLGLAGQQFALMVHDGFVWFTDPAADTSGVITDDLDARSIVVAGRADGSLANEGENRRTTVPVEVTDRCDASPTVATPRQRVTLTVPSGRPELPAEAWKWSMPDGEPPSATGPQATTSWVVKGEHIVTVVAQTDTTLITATCTVTVEILSSPMTIPPETTIPADDTTSTTVGPTTTVEADDGGATATTVPDTTTTSTQPSTTTTTTEPPTTITSTEPPTTTTTPDPEVSTPGGGTDPERPEDRIGGIAAGGDHTVAMLPDGTLWAWGFNGYGQLGIPTNAGTGNPNPFPTQVGGLPAMRAVSAGYNHTVALDSAGVVWTWGTNRAGQLGTPTNSGVLEPPNPTPTNVAGLPEIATISAGSEFTVVLGTDGSVWTWGSNTYGELGRSNAGGVRANPTPTKVTGLPPIAAISAGFTHTLALDEQGGVWAWGSNMSGQLGNATNIGLQTPNPTPQVIVGLPTISALAANTEGSWSFAIDEQGGLWTWGIDGAEANSRPELMSGLPAIEAISGGSNHVMALATDGRVWTWGFNFSGQLGVAANSGTSTVTTVPVQVSVRPVAYISAGESHSASMEADGSVWTWGENFSGELGNDAGGWDDYPTPRLVAGVPP